MSNYWRNEEKIEVSQTQVSIPSTNGRSFTLNAGTGTRRLDFEIPPTVKFMDGKNTNLVFDIKIGLGAGSLPTRLSLDPFIGGNSVVKNLRIYSGSRLTLLEEISDYNAKVQIEYSYNTDDSLKKMRAMKEGCLLTTVENRGTQGTSVSNNIDTNTNPYIKPILAVTAGTDFGNDDFVTAKLTLPIHSGIFSGSSAIFPVLMTQGLFCEFDIEDPKMIIKQLDSVVRHRRIKQNPHFHGIAAAGTKMSIGVADLTTIYLARTNNMFAIKECPFVVGERIGICSKTDPNLQANLTQADGTAFHPKITNITVSGGYVLLTVETFRNSAVGTGTEVTSNNFVIYSASIDNRRVQVDDRTTVVGTLTKLTKYDCNYTLSNANIVLQSVAVDSRYEAGMVAKMREGGAIEIDIHSVTNYKHSLLKSNRNATINLAVSNERAKCSIIMMTDANTYDTADLIGCLADTYDEETNTMDGRLNSYRTGQVGIIDELTSYQLLVDNKLVPSRPISVSKINKGVSITPMPLTELEKALNQAKIIPRSFADYNRNFLIGRAYALSDGVANLNNVSNQLQLLYNERTVAGVDRPPAKDKLVFAFVFHLRRIVIKGDSVTVQV